MVIGNRPKTVDGFALGDLVEIRSAEEILAGLDTRGEHDSLQFMPEMLQYCGRTFRIDKIAGKTCDTVNWSGLREMQNTVHLADARCDGQAHGGCQAGCLIYWKTSWLKPATGNSAGSGAPGLRTLPIAAVTQPEATPRAACTPQRLAEVAHGGCRPRPSTRRQARRSTPVRPQSFRGPSAGSSRCTTPGSTLTTFATATRRSGA